MIDDLIQEMKKNNNHIVVCSFDDCRKVRIGKYWYNHNYDESYKLYSHSVCIDCYKKHYGGLIK